MKTRAWLCAALGLSLACRARPAEAGPQACSPSESSLAPDASVEGLAGQYRLQLVASSGPNAGSVAAGELRLLPYKSASRPGATYPFYGAAEVSLEKVGAVAGDPASLDPGAPGVLVMRIAPQSDTAATRLMLRLGAEANRPGVVRFDGGYTVLRVREIEDDGFAGDWESGAPLPRARGHFCAVRMGDEDD